MVRRFQEDSIVIGKVAKTKGADGKKTYTQQPLKKYRIIVQERSTTENAKEGMKSFMVYDYNGKTTIEKIKKKLNNAFKTKKKAKKK